MRSLHFAAAACLVALPLATLPAGFTPAQAQTATPAPAPMPAPATEAPSAAAEPAPMTAPAPMSAPKTAHKRQTLQQHFEAANTTHDGHLTKEQASAAHWSYVNKHFGAIDKDHKGYVTVEDIHAYAHAAHAAHHPKAATPAAATTN